LILTNALKKGQVLTNALKKGQVLTNAYKMGLVLTNQLHLYEINKIIVLTNLISLLTITIKYANFL